MVFVPKWPFFQLFILGNVGRYNVFYDILEQKTPFQTIKTTGSKTRKIDIFPTFIFQEINARKISFTIFQNEKTPFQAIKTRSSKTRKIDIFPKALTHNFGPKMAIFLTCFFRQYGPGKCLLRYIQNEKTPFQPIKRRSSKSQKIDIFPKGLTQCLCPKMAIFSNFFFLGNIGQENIFYDILERENAFLGYKKKTFKQS